MFTSKFKKVAIRSQTITLNQIILLYIKVTNTTNFFNDYGDIDLVFYNLFWFKSNIFFKKIEIKLLNFTAEII